MLIFTVKQKTPGGLEYALTKFKGDIYVFANDCHLNQQHCRKTIHRGPFTEDEVNRIVAKWEAAGKKNRVYGGLYKAVEPSDILTTGTYLDCWTNLVCKPIGCIYGRDLHSRPLFQGNYL